MASRLNPYLNFPGNARQAMQFYHSVFGGELQLMTFGEVDPDAGDIAEQIMHGQLETPAGYTLMVSDLPPGMPHNPGNTITVSLSGEGPDGQALREFWEKLTASGTVTVPLDKQVWGDEFGACVDQFGVPWMVNIRP